jgi:hypothetical protein
MSGDRIIELDDRWDHLDDGPEPVRRRFALRARPVLAVVLALLCLATLVASRRPPLPPLSLISFLTMPREGGIEPSPGEMTLAAGLLLVQTGGRLVAFEPDGSVRWRATMGANDGYSGYWLWQGHLLVERNTADDVTTIALDPATGAERWRLPGFPQPVGDLFVVDNGRDRKQIYQSLPLGLLWTVPESRSSTVDEKAGSLWAITTGGVLTEYDLRTGTVRRSATVKVPQVEGAGDEFYLLPFDTRIMLRAQRYGTNGLPVFETLSYDRETLQPASTPLAQFDYLGDCGPVWCAYIGERVSIVDRVSLAQLWQAPEGEFPYWVGTGMIITPTQRARMVDPLTGRLLVDLEGWNPAGTRVATGTPQLSWMTKFVGPKRTLVGRLTSNQLQVVGSLPHQVVECQADGDLLACVIADGRIGVWRINPGAKTL